MYQFIWQTYILNIIVNDKIHLLCYVGSTVTFEYTGSVKCILKVSKRVNPNIHFTYEKEVESKLFVMVEMAADLYSKFIENQLIVMFTSTATLFYQIMKKELIFKRFKRIKQWYLKYTIPVRKQDQNLLSQIRPFLNTCMTSNIVYIGNCPTKISLDG